MSQEHLRDRTRRAVRAELSESAQELFLAQGYEATTVDQIAEAAGMSRRSFFRYFATKDDVVIDKYELLGDQLLDAVGARPADEPTWDSLRHAFDVVVHYYADPHRRDRAAVMQRIVSGSPSLQARYLQRWEAVQNRLADLLHQRAVDRGDDFDLTIASATVGAATSCLSAALRHALATDNIDTFGSTLDRLMFSLRPTAV